MADYIAGWQEHPGNATVYDMAHVAPLKTPETAVHKGCRLFALGSSVTWGYASGGQAVGEYLAQRFGWSLTKDAVNGTCIASKDPQSYLHRLQQHSHSTDQPDLFLVQLSTNDAHQGFSPEETTHALALILDYIAQEWAVPVYVYTSTRFDSEAYDRMVEAARGLAQQRTDVTIIDLWHNKTLNAATDADKSLYMMDSIHPTRAGYARWWGPEMEKAFLRSHSAKKSLLA
ncbi:SGNH/GDSL hydrolase family protein [Alloscardovia criceti]|uniref:SGNH/GDSL hydrolase family protein n=1 Tax=Alloscardovia criceti TaxID=356828 RepID=UPI000371D1DB|nr:SGNH/GDSL hydrolase family protein [Alloscardovia criceti]